MLSQTEQRAPRVNRSDQARAVALWVSGSPPANAAKGFAAKGELSRMLRLRDVRKMRHLPLFLLVATAALISPPVAGNTRAAEPKRVLLIHSFAIAAPPFTV